MLRPIHVNYQKFIDETEINNRISDKQYAVDLAFHTAKNVLRDLGYRVAADDRAERLVEAIATYLVESE